MTKSLAVFVREYLEVVRKKSFIIMTVLAPFLFAALMFIPTMLAVKGMSAKSVVVVDSSGKLGPAFAEDAKVPAGPPRRDTNALAGGDEALGKAAPLTFVYVAASGDPRVAAQPYLDRLTAGDRRSKDKVDGVLLIPADVFSATDVKLTFFSRTATDLMTQQRVERIVNRAVSRERLTARGLTESDIARVLTSIPVQAVKLSKTGEETKGGELNFLLGFVFVALLMIPMLVYGQEIMRGIVQEKGERIVEILISSMRPLQLLAGKVLGLAAVGLTQVGVWLVMGAAVAAYAGGAAAMAGLNLAQFFKLSLIPWFFLYYILGYLTFVCIYAIGGAISNSEKEAQQFLGPLMMLMMLPWFLAMPILQDPESRLATVLSLIPVYTPITMFMRVVVSEPPLWQIGLSVALSAATIYVLFWATAKIFRIGILSYGKRPTIPELVRWIKVA